MRSLLFGAKPHPTATVEEKIEWIMRALTEVQNASNEPDALDIAQNYTVDNVTTTRTYDANSTDADELADVLGTFLQDLRKRGPKRNG